MTGQDVVPVYEGWEQNQDGSFNVVFGYFNRNWEEELDVQPGPDNNIEPGGPDQGQPTHFLPRRNRFLVRVHVPKDFGNKEVVWTLTTRGKTTRAYATLKPDYFIDDIVIMNNNGAGGPGGGSPDTHGNKAPKLEDRRWPEIAACQSRRAGDAGGGRDRRREAEDAADAVGAKRGGKGRARHPQRRNRPASLMVRVSRRGEGQLRSGPDRNVGRLPGWGELAMVGGLADAAGAG